MQASGACIHLRTGQGGGDDGGAHPDAKVSDQMVLWIAHPKCLSARSHERKDTGGGQRGGSISTKLGAARHFAPYGADVTQRFVEIVHNYFTMQSKGWPGRCQDRCGRQGPLTR